MAYGGQQMVSRDSVQEKMLKAILSNNGTQQHHNLQPIGTFPRNSWDNTNALNSRQFYPRSPGTPNNFTRMLNDSQMLFSRLGLNNDHASMNNNGKINWKTPNSSTMRNEDPVVGNNFKLGGTSEGRYSQITYQIESFTKQHSQSVELLNRKQNLRSALLFVIRKRYPQASLFLFGSSWNGFGSDTSDIDFCLFISPGRKMNQSQKEAERYLRDIKTLLFPINKIKGLQFIFARVPILKFTDTISGCQCDLSVNNDMAIRNTHLLRTYSKVDDRVHPFVMAVKKWAHERKINDPTQGTLSSYALVLMCLHYLQCGCRPPVLNSLQKMYPHLFKADSDINQLMTFEPWQSIPCNSSGNKESVGQLLVGFFQYFTHSFSWDTHVVSVREGCALEKRHYKEYRDKYMYVEDPFEFYNTARTVYDLSLFNLIKREFRRANWRLTERLSFYHIT